MKRIAFVIFNPVFVLFAFAQSTEFIPYTQKMPGSTLSFKMVPIKGGSFMLGSAETEKDRAKDEGPQKNIQISSFWMSAYEVTRDEFDVFYKDESTSMNVDVDAITRPSPQYVDLSWGMGKEGGYPANSMSQFGAMMYGRWLYQKTGVFYRLPTEAEWEYACRAGTTTTYYFGNDANLLGDYAWYEKNSENKFQKVGQKKPNAWGLYDMLGNLMEWTLDHYQPEGYSLLASQDPMVAPNSKKYPKSLRGGAYGSTASELRNAQRFYSDPEWNRRDPQLPRSKWWLTEAGFVGIRLLRPFVQPAKAEVDAFFVKYLGK